VDCARWKPRRSSRPSPIIHDGWWRARRAKLVSSGCPLFDGFVVRSGLCVTGEGDTSGALPRCSRPESRSSVLTPKEALRSPFPGGDHLFLATSTSKSRGAFRCARRPGDPCSRGGGDPLPGPSLPCSRGLLHSTMPLGTPLDRATPSTSPRETHSRDSSLGHVNGFVKFATRGERNAFADSSPISRLGRPEIALFVRVARAPNPLPDAGLCQSFPRQHCSHGFPH